MMVVGGLALGAVEGFCAPPRPGRAHLAAILFFFTIGLVAPQLFK
jgi:hypothetical protein